MGRVLNDRTRRHDDLCATLPGCSRRHSRSPTERRPTQTSGVVGGLKATLLQPGPRPVRGRRRHDAADLRLRESSRTAASISRSSPGRSKTVRHHPGWQVRVRHRGWTIGIRKTHPAADPGRAELVRRRENASASDEVAHSPSVSTCRTPPRARSVASRVGAGPSASFPSAAPPETTREAAPAPSSSARCACAADRSPRP